MQPYAVIESGGKQYRVSAGDTLKVDRLEAEVGTQLNVTPVLAVSDGTTLTFGKPEVAGAVVTAQVVEHLRGKKVVSFKKKRRKGYHRKIGQRSDLTVLKVDSIR
jgi:large subunit ribosomal protein L21